MTNHPASKGRFIMPRRNFLSGATTAATLATGLMAGSSRAFAAGEPIKIGVLAPITDHAGADNLSAARLAATEINAVGGVLGRPLDIVMGDEEAVPEKAIQAFQTLAVRHKVSAILGGFRSGAVIALLPYIARFKVPFLVTGAASPSLMKPVLEDYATNKYIFRTSANTDRLAVDLAGACRDVLFPAGIKRYAIAGENYKWAREYGDLLKKTLQEHGAEVVCETTHDPAVTDFTPTFREAVNAKAQGLLVIISNQAGYALVKQWRDQRVPLHLAGNNNVSMLLSTFWDDTQGACEYEFSAGCKAPITRTTLSTLDKLETVVGAVPFITALAAYDSVYMIKHAMEATRSTKADDLVTALEAIDYDGAYCRHVFGKDHDSLYSTFPYGQWQGGQKVSLWQKEYAQGQYKAPPWINS